MSRIPTRDDGGEREFELTLRLCFRAGDGWDPVASAHDFDHEPTQRECVVSQVFEAVPGVLPDDSGDEAATLVECREMPSFSLEDIEVLAAFALGGIADGPEGCWELSDHAEVLRAKLRQYRAALADAMERYEGEGRGS